MVLIDTEGSSTGIGADRPECNLNCKETHDLGWTCSYAISFCFSISENGINNISEEICVESLAQSLVRCKFSLNDSYHYCHYYYHPHFMHEELRRTPVLPQFAQLLVEGVGAEQGFQTLGPCVFPSTTTLRKPRAPRSQPSGIFQSLSGLHPSV